MVKLNGLKDEYNSKLYLEWFNAWSKAF